MGTRCCPKCPARPASPLVAATPGSSNSRKGGSSGSGGAHTTTNKPLQQVSCTSSRCGLDRPHPTGAKATGIAAGEVPTPLARHITVKKAALPCEVAANLFRKGLAVPLYGQPHVGARQQSPPWSRRQQPRAATLGCAAGALSSPDPCSPRSTSFASKLLAMHRGGAARTVSIGTVSPARAECQCCRLNRA